MFTKLAEIISEPLVYTYIMHNTRTVRGTHPHVDVPAHGHRKIHIRASHARVHDPYA